MRILQVSTSDRSGGAEAVARQLHTAYRASGHRPRLAVGFKRTSDPDVVEIPRRPEQVGAAGVLWRVHGRMAPLDGRLPGARGLRTGLRLIAGGRPAIDRALGLEDFHHPGSRGLLDLMPEMPDIVHVHNLHGGYFDLRTLQRLSRRLPVVVTLHDEWMLTGHCAYSLACDRWMTGCGHCPDLTIYPAISRDATKTNWKRKRRIYGSSQLHVSAPSQWLLDRARQSMIQALEYRHLPYGVDLSLFKPADQARSRHALGLPLDARIVLFAARGAGQNPFKDYATIENAMMRVARDWQHPPSLIFLTLGADEGSVSTRDGLELHQVPYTRDPRKVAHYIQAADLFLHAAHADNLPLAVIEALACGKPVIATAVGGVSEEILDGETGHLVPPRDAMAMSEHVLTLLRDGALCRAMGQAGARDAKQRFSLDRMIRDHLDWYAEILVREAHD